MPQRGCRRGGGEDTENARPNKRARAPPAATEKTAASSTVEEHLNARVDVLVGEVQGHATELIERFRTKIERSVEDIVAAANESSSLSQSVNVSEGSGSSAANADVDNPAAAAEARNLSVHFQVEGGPYEGRTFALAPVMDGAPLWIGRSRGKKFANGGISMPKDPEVSTTHAKVEAANGKIFFTDQESSNGTEINGVTARPYVAHELQDGGMVTIGSTVMKVVILNT